MNGGSGQSRKGLLVLMVVAALLWGARYHPPATSHFIYDGDASQHVYWTAKYQDPELFPDDLLTRFIVSTGFDPVGYRLVYRGGATLMDPLPFSQLLTLLLLLLSLWLLDKLCRELMIDPRGRIFCGTLFLLFSLYDASGGFPRTFAFPLLLAFLVLYQKGRFRAASGCALLPAFFYPPVILNLLALAGWDLTARWPRQWRKRRYWVDAACLALVVVVAGGFLFSVYGGGDESFGVKVGYEQAREMAEFHPGGRTVFFRDGLLEYLLVAPSGIGVYRLIGFAAILGILGWIRGFRSMKFPPVAVHLLWTSLVLFTAAHLVLFRLHHPSRYTLYTLPLALILLVGANAGPAFQKIGDFFRNLPARPPRPLARLTLAVFVIVGAVIYTHAQGQYFSRLDMATAEPPEVEAVAFLETLPKDALVAGHPEVMNLVPVLARRKVLASHELSLPYYPGYYDRVRQRILDFFRAYYAHSMEEVDAFARRYGVDALVVRKSHFSPEFLRGRIYYEPFGTFVKKRVKEGGPFVLEDPPRERRCFDNGEYVVLCFEKEKEK